MVTLRTSGQRVRQSHPGGYHQWYGRSPHICAFAFFHSTVIGGVHRINGRTHAKAGLFSAVLTAFVIDSNQSIQTTPALQSAWSQTESVALLRQISEKLASPDKQIPLPSVSWLPGFDTFPSVSDVRVNIMWTISLVSSLTAALLATLIRQWARDHMRIFQRYSDPLKVARIRQYLHESSKRTYMLVLAEAVPGLVHISLFLFLAGLAEFHLNIHPTVGRYILIPIILCAALYIIITAPPVIFPQSSYRTPYSPLVWYIVRKVRIQLRSRGRLGFTLLRGSTMAEGQMQLAMKQSDARKHRDERAIRWLVNTLTYNVQDSETLTLGIPGSFATAWGVGVWEGAPIDDKDKLYRDIGRLFETCGDRESFKSEDEWHVRSRACTEAMALFVLFMGADIAMIRNPGKLLSDIGNNGRTREVSEIRSHQSFVIRWTCLSLVAIRKMLHSPQWHAYIPLQQLVAFHPEDNLCLTETALRNSQRIDEQFATTSNHVERLRQVSNMPGGENLTRDRITEILRQYEPELTPILDQVETMERLEMDASPSELQERIDKVTHKLIRKLPGVAFDDIKGATAVDQIRDFLANPV